MQDGLKIPVIAQEKATTGRVIRTVSDESGNPIVFEDSDTCREYLFSQGYAKTLGGRVKGFEFIPILPDTKAKDMNPNGKELLRHAVVKQAVVDYMSSIKALDTAKTEEDRANAEHDVKSLRNFFMGPIFEIYCDADPKWLIYELEQRARNSPERKKGNKKRNKKKN